MWRGYLAGLVLLLGLSACSARPAPPSVGTAATLVVYQAPTSYAQAQGPLIYVNGVARGRLALGRVLSLPVSPGPLRVSVHEPLLLWAGRELAMAGLTLAPGQTGYMRLTVQRLSVDAGGMVHTQAILEDVEAALGEARR